MKVKGGTSPKRVYYPRDIKGRSKPTEILCHTSTLKHIFMGVEQKTVPGSKQQKSMCSVNNFLSHIEPSGESTTAI